MSNAYLSYVPKTVGEVMDQLASMMLTSPTFKDLSGSFPERSIDKEFQALNKELKLIRPKVGDERFEQLVAMSAKMRAHFEADPNDETEDGLLGRDIIHEMRQLLRGARRKSAGA